MNLFEVAKTIPVTTLAEKYGGVKLSKRGGTYWSCCPLHSERTASCKYDQKGFYCFGCHEHGSGIDLVMKLLDLDSVSACKKICEDFQLNCGLNNTENNRVVWRNRRIEKDTRETIENVFRHAHIVMTDYDQMIDDIISRNYTMEEYASQDMPEEVVNALKSKDEVSQALDEYDRISVNLNNSSEEKMRFLEEYKDILSYWSKVVGANRKVVNA